MLFQTITRDAYIKSIPGPVNIEFTKYNPIKTTQKSPCFVKIEDKGAERLESLTVREPSLQYAITARCKDFAPNVQHDELPKVACKKLPKKLKDIRKMIVQSSKKGSLRKNFDDLQSSMDNIDLPNLTPKLNCSVECSSIENSRESQKGVHWFTNNREQNSKYDSQAII